MRRFQTVRYSCIIVISRTFYNHGIYSVSQKSSPPLKISAIFSLPVNLYNWKFIVLVVAQLYPYVYTNFGPFIWILRWIVSLFLVRLLKF